MLPRRGAWWSRFGVCVWQQMTAIGSVVFALKGSHLSLPQLHARFVPQTLQGW